VTVARALSLACLIWMHAVVRRMVRARAAEVATHIEEHGTPVPVLLRVACPVHAVQAQVRVLVTPRSGAVAPAGCSLHDTAEGAAGCEWNCVARVAQEA
jgi:hypothetical protein